MSRWELNIATFLKKKSFLPKIIPLKCSQDVGFVCVGGNISQKQQIMETGSGNARAGSYLGAEERPQLQMELDCSNKT